MADALFSACFLNACLRHADIVDIACFSPIVNTRGAIFVDKDGITRRTTYYVFYMYTNYLEKYNVPLTTNFAKLTDGKSETGVFDAVLTSDEVTLVPHEELIVRLDKVSSLCRVVIIKTPLTLPYTSTFFELDCGYWDAEREAAIRR